MKASFFYPRAAAVLLAVVLTGCATTNTAPWPDKIVSVDSMKVLTPLQMKFVNSYEDKSGRLTAVLVVHVDAEGKVVRTRVEQSSGNARVDEAAKLSLLNARFAPYVENGAAEAVSVVMPMHVPVRKL